MMMIDKILNGTRSSKKSVNNILGGKSTKVGFTNVKNIGIGNILNQGKSKSTNNILGGKSNGLSFTNVKSVGIGNILNPGKSRLANNILGGKSNGIGFTNVSNIGVGNILGSKQKVANKRTMLKHSIMSASEMIGDRKQMKNYSVEKTP